MEIRGRTELNGGKVPTLIDCEDPDTHQYHASLVFAGFSP